MGIPILKVDNALQSSDVSMYPYHPCSKDVCENGGRCNPMLESYECVCRHGFSGKHCQEGECCHLTPLSFSLEKKPTYLFRARFTYVFAYVMHYLKYYGYQMLYFK